MGAELPPEATTLDLEAIKAEYDVANAATPRIATNWSTLSRHVPALLSEVDRLNRLLDEKSEEVDDKSEIGHAMVDAWERRAAALVAEVERLREAKEATRLLGVARMALDLAATGPSALHSYDAIQKECGDVAQRIVDLIGHDVTDEPPHAVVERDELRAEVERLRWSETELTQAVRLCDQEADEMQAELQAENAELKRIAGEAVLKYGRAVHGRHK